MALSIKALGSHALLLHRNIVSSRAHCWRMNGNAAKRNKSNYVYRYKTSLCLNSTVVWWSIFPPVTRKTRVHFPAAEAFVTGGERTSPVAYALARLQPVPQQSIETHQQWNLQAVRPSSAGVYSCALSGNMRRGTSVEERSQHTYHSHRTRRKV